MNLLRIDSSILGEFSVSRAVSAAVVKRLTDLAPETQVVYRDLGATDLLHLQAGHMAVAQGAIPDQPALISDLAQGATMLEEFMAADTVVIGAPMYNFTAPSQLKAWIDRILVAGKTFRYGEHGAIGLSGDKRVILALSRGNVYSQGSPVAGFEHLESYLRTICSFIGIDNPEVVSADGVQLGPDYRERALATAIEAASQLTL